MTGCDGINASYKAARLTFSLIIGFCFSDFLFYIFNALGLIDKIGPTKGCSLLHQLIQPNVSIFLGDENFHCKPLNFKLYQKNLPGLPATHQDLIPTRIDDMV